MVKFKIVINSICGVVKKSHNVDDLLKKLKAEIAWIKINKKVIDDDNNRKKNKSKKI